MSEEQRPIPEYMKQDPENPKRYICSACKKSVSLLFADLGCECDGKGVSENYHALETRLEEIIADIQRDEHLTEDEKANLKSMVDGEL